MSNWTRKEVRLLKELVSYGEDIKFMESALNRNYQSIYKKLTSLGYKHKTIFVKEKNVTKN